MSLHGAVDVLTDGERARYPQSLAITARFLTRGEEESWRDGWLEAKAEGAEYGDSLHVVRTAEVLRIRPRHEACCVCPVARLAVAA